ncbi:MAG: IS607 family transposase [Desulfovibrionaceae bacterium]|nr:IS607 family transposase [Desulfovibrionaceae bacterium]
MKYYSIHSFCKILGITPQTARNWERSGQLLPHHKSQNGYRYYSEDQLQQVINLKKNEQKIIGYCRVSSQKQKDELAKQIEDVSNYLNSHYKNFEIIQDIGSVIDYNKKGLLGLIKRINNNEIEKIVVLHKDRLLRFGFELFENFAKLHDCSIEIIDDREITEEQELVEDLIQIITVFSSDLQGNIANKANKIIEELKNNN